MARSEPLPSVVAALASAPQRRDTRFAYWFARVSRALAQHLLRHVQAEYGINLAEFRILATLADLEATSIRDVAAEAALDKAHVTRAVARLMRRGLVLQVVDTRDRRLRVIRLTRAGRALMKTMLPFVIERQRTLEQSLSQTERRALWKALTTLTRKAELMLEDETRRTRRKRERAVARRQ